MTHLHLGHGHDRVQWIDFIDITNATSQRLTSEMNSLPGVAIGALIALCGVLIAQLVAMIQSRLERQNKREILLRTKYEELGLHFLDSMKLTNKMMLCASHEETLTVLHQTDANQAHLLAMVYFPLLQNATGQYIETYAALCIAANSAYNPSDKRVLGMQVFDNSAYVEARNSHIKARDYLQDQIRAHAATYAKA